MGQTNVENCRGRDCELQLEILSGLVWQLLGLPDLFHRPCIMLLKVDRFEGFLNRSNTDELVINTTSGCNYKNYKLNKNNYKLNNSLT